MAGPSQRLTPSQQDAINRALIGEVPRQVQRLLNGLPPADAAHLLESAPPRIRALLWNLIDRAHEGDVFQELGDDVQQFFLKRMNVDELKSLTEGQDVDDIADMLQQLPESITEQVLSSMTAQDRHRVEQVLSYPEDSAGGLMNTDTITVRPSITLDVVFRFLRWHDQLPPMTDNLWVVNRQDELIGLLPINKLLVSPPSLTVRELMLTDEIPSIAAEMPAHEVARLFERQDLISAPVVNTEGKLLGRITIDDVVDVIRDEGDHSLMSSVGLDEDEDTFAPVLQTSQRRALWLGINLITAFIASAVIGLFQDTIDKVVALAVLMPIVASMGGIAGSQTLTLVIRAMALGQLGRGNTRWLISREAAVGLLNGALWALVVGLAAWLWFNEPIIAVVIAMAIVINLAVAVVAGASIPLVPKAMRIDPALAGSVVLTTVTDVVGFMAFLGLATAFYAG